MPRSRTTKTIAKRIDLGYFKRPHALRTWKRRMTWLAGIVALVWVSMASMRFTNGRPSLDDQIHNPAPVTEAHAMFENDCMQCHAPKPGGSFALSVTDESCLRCHDGSLHHANQKQTGDLALVSRKTKVLAMADTSHPHGARSAACVTCHVEHKGKAILSATSDAHCIVCHDNLTTAATDAAPKSAKSVTGFDLARHPTFGRKLRDAGGTWVDPTVLKFNHKAHLENASAFKNVANNCVVCHTPDPGDRRYMLPVSYEQHCQKCHELRPMPETSPLAHEDMALIRSQLASPGMLFERTLAAMSREQREALLVRQVRSGRTTRTEKIPQEQWIKDKVAALNKAALEWLASDEAKKLPGAEVLSASATQPTEENRGTLRMLESFAAFGMSQSCSRCHKVEQTSNLEAFVTAPTGMGPQPRRWFRDSLFSHDDHRDQSCRDCHDGAWTSTATSDLLMPDLNKAAAGAQTCVDCHHPDRSPAERGAPTACYTCHTFHDRKLEKPLLTMKK